MQSVLWFGWCEEMKMHTIKLTTMEIDVILEALNKVEYTERVRSIKYDLEKAKTMQSQVSEK